MLEYDQLDSYRENNRLEVKKAAGGLPRSIWESYSAFANTDGGIILLGVEESENRSLRIASLGNPEDLISQFWNTINNPQKISANILVDRHVRIIEVNEQRVIEIEVPRANRQDKPVYVGENPFTGTYRRNGEGDYHCTKEEIRNMLRDQTDVSQDLKVLTNVDVGAFDFDSIKRYRLRMAVHRPGHVWEGLDEEEFLQKISAARRSEDHKIRPTAAGLLMFGTESEIVKEFPDYFLDYQENTDEDLRWTDRIISTSGDWSGNLFDFYFRVYNKIALDIKVPFGIEKGTDRIDDTPVHQALREALANALIHANYYGRRGVVVKKQFNAIVIANPGGLRISIEDAVSGGVSDPRNAALIKMFNLINIGERAGSGLPNIHHVWEQEKWPVPELKEEFDPDRTTLILKMQKSAIKIGDRKQAIKIGDRKSLEQKEAIIAFFKKNPICKTADVAEYLGLKPSRARDYLSLLVKDGTISAEGKNRNRIYRLNQ